MSTKLALVDNDLDNATIIDALDKTQGNLSAAANLLGVRRNVLATRVNNSTELRAVHMDMIDAVLDKAKDNVFDAVREGDYGASTFVLTTLGKDQGFSTKQEFVAKKETNFKEMTIEELEVLRDNFVHEMADKYGYVRSDPGSSPGEALDNVKALPDKKDSS